MTLKQEKNRAKFLDSRLDDETASKVEKWNLALLAVTAAACFVLLFLTSS